MLDYPGISLYWNKDKGLKGALARLSGSASLQDAALTFSVGLNFTSDPILTVDNADITKTVNTAARLEFEFELAGAAIATAIGDEAKTGLYYQLEAIAVNAAPIIHQGILSLRPGF